MPPVRPIRHCEECGNRLLPHVPRKRQEPNGKLLCPSCIEGRPGRTRAQAKIAGHDIPQQGEKVDDTTVAEAIHPADAEGKDWVIRDAQGNQYPVEWAAEGDGKQEWRKRSKLAIKITPDFVGSILAVLGGGEPIHGYRYLIGRTNKGQPVFFVDGDYTMAIAEGPVWEEREKAGFPAGTRAGNGRVINAPIIIVTGMVLFQDPFEITERLINILPHLAPRTEKLVTGDYDQGYADGQADAMSNSDPIVPADSYSDEYVKGYYDAYYSSIGTLGSKIAHDGGQDAVLYHCAFCGSGALVARSDGSTECTVCHKVFTVQMQPEYSAMPQTMNGQAVDIPNMPGDATEPPPFQGNEPSDAQAFVPPASPDQAPDAATVPTVPAPAFIPPQQKQSILSHLEPLYVNANGYALSDPDYLKHLAIRHADDPAEMIEQIKAENAL